MNNRNLYLLKPCYVSSDKTDRVLESSFLKILIFKAKINTTCNYSIHSFRLFL